jgi:hypothetical protein
MSILEKETIKGIADVYGFTNLPDDVTHSLAADLEYRLRELTQVGLLLLSLQVYPRHRADGTTLKPQYAVWGSITAAF